MKRLLFVDDDPNILKINKLYFEPYGYTVDTALDVPNALERLSNFTYDCIILDVVLKPGENGYRLCTEIRKTSNAPIIFLTSLTEQDFLYQGFSVGGDDYMTKPYDPKELKIRIEARINRYRNTSQDENTLSFPPLHINLSTRQITLNEEVINLTGVEFDILILLASNPGKLYMPDVIYKEVWKMPDLNATHTVQTHIARLRRKLDKLSPDHHFIQTQWGKGYLFVTPPQKKIS